MPWHPAVVHLPVALLTFALVVDLAALLRRRVAWHGYAYATQVTGTVAAAAAMLTGNQAAAVYRDSVFAVAIQRHEDLGSLAFVLFVVIVLGRLPAMLRRGGDRPAAGAAASSRREGRLWIALSAVAVGVLWVASHHGGRLVYELGVGVGGG